MAEDEGQGEECSLDMEHDRDDVEGTSIIRLSISRWSSSHFWRSWKRTPTSSAKQLTRFIKSYVNRGKYLAALSQTVCHKLLGVNV